MSLYIFNSAQGIIPESAKARIASDVTDIHCDSTGAPKASVHVFFLEDAPQRPLHGRSIFVFGTVRAGPTADEKRTMVDGIRASVCNHAGLAKDEVIVGTADIPPGWVMEGGG